MAGLKRSAKSGCSAMFATTPAATTLVPGGGRDPG